MRKYKDEGGIRPYKTPSPPNYNDFKSPRINRNNSNQFDLNKRAHHQEHKYNIPQQKQPLDVFKAYLLETRQRENISSNESEEEKNKKIKAYKNIQNTKKHKTQNDSNPYNSYFLSHQTNGAKKQIAKQNESGISKPISRRSSLSRDQSQQSPGDGRNSYQETIRKLANQNIRLRHECKIIQQKYQRTLSDKNNVSAERNYLQAELERLGRINEELICKQASMLQEIKSLKKILSINCDELSQSNYQIYKMKQQIFQLTMNKQKFEGKAHARHSSKTNNLTDSKHSSIGSMKLITTQTTIDSRQTTIACKGCKKNSLSIAQLTTENENLKFQLNQKTTIINSLCSQIQRIEAELRLVQKPRMIFRKFGNMISELGNQLVLQKAKELNTKYAKYCK